MMEGIAAEHLCGVILTGGASRRMGRDKAMLTLDDETFIDRIAAAMTSVLNDVLLSGSDIDRARCIGLRSVPDEIPSVGPLGGIYSAFHSTDADALVVAACDLPFVTTELLKCLMDFARSNAVVYAADSREAQPLLGVYPRSVLPVLDRYLCCGGRSVHRFLAEIESIPVRVDEHIHNYDMRSLLNVNTPEEYAAMKSSDWAEIPDGKAGMQL